MQNTEVYFLRRSDDWHRVRLTNFPYLTLSDVKKIYCVVNDWNDTGLEDFTNIARKIATKVPGDKTDYIYQFMDESALFELFKMVLPLQLDQKGIDSWGRLMQFIS